MPHEIEVYVFHLSSKMLSYRLQLLYILHGSEYVPDCARLRHLPYHEFFRARESFTRLAERSFALSWKISLTRNRQRLLMLKVV